MNGWLSSATASLSENGLHLVMSTPESNLPSNLVAGVGMGNAAADEFSTALVRLARSLK